MYISFLGKDRSGPIGMIDNKYEEESKLWHMMVDFATMPKLEFSLKEVATYHTQPLEYYDNYSLSKLEIDGYIKINRWG